MPEELKNENENSVKNDSTDENNSGGEKKTPEKKQEDDFKRNIEEEKPKEKKAGDVVPLKKYLDKKATIKALELENSTLKMALESGSNSINNKDLDELAKEFGADPTALKKLAAALTPKQNDALEKKIADLEESNKQLLAKEKQREAEKLFEKNFKSKIVENYPDLKDKKSLFKKIWFSNAFPELKTLTDIKNELFPNLKGVEKKDGGKVNLESGSGGTHKGAKVIDFKNMTDDQHLEVLRDPKLKAEYYKWQDSQR